MNALIAHGLGALATVYITCCFVYLDGPLDVFMRLRAYVAKRGWWMFDELLKCPWCTGFWAGLVCALMVWQLQDLNEGWIILMALAYAAVAGLLLEQNEMVKKAEEILEETRDVAQWGT